MTGFVLDTNVISETRRIRPHGGVMAWLNAVDTANLGVSAVTIGEIGQGISAARRVDPLRAAGLEVWLEGVLRTTAVFPFDAECGRIWGRLARGREVHLVVDSMIAATALSRGLTVATRNTADFEPFGVAVFNPFSYRV